ncbi:FUSC family protein [Actinorhabdospora filicis]|uniref:FUSC family protein n=1 Tax=Actinorhabdospora filicis TaxID=1785913 RepID=UPI0025521113|nr:FUSC family protein [Actinorhabdospora filicis]
MRAVTWRWPDALHAALAVAPAVVLVAGGHVAQGAALAVGTLPVGLMGLGGPRRKRPVAVIAGVLFGLGVLVGSVLALNAVAAVAGIFALCLGAAMLAARSALGPPMLSLIVPSASVGLSCEVGTAAGLAVVIAIGSVWSGLLALLWPDGAGGRTPPPRMGEKYAPAYGTLLGLAAAVAVATGLLLGVPHLGWASTAALLVMRPDREMLTVRAVGRVAATIAGAFAACAVIALGVPVGWVAALIGLATVAGIATAASRWYLASGATAFIVLTMMLYGVADQAQIQRTFWLRVGENLYGVALALLFGIVVPLLLRRVRRARA